MAESPRDALDQAEKSAKVLWTEGIINNDVCDDLMREAFGLKIKLARGADDIVITSIYDFQARVQKLDPSFKEEEVAA